MTADNPEKKNFYTQLEVGKAGEQLVHKTLRGRSHWNSRYSTETWINPEVMVCEAQRWYDITEEHQNNRDYKIKVNACKNCRFDNCLYKKEEPYPDRINNAIHEVKTNEATHTRLATDDKVKVKEIKDYDPTGNLFIEYWQNPKRWELKYDDEDITREDRYPEHRKGWFLKGTTASWYHFYQPVVSNDQDNITKQHKIAQQFKRQMGTNDRLLLKKEFGYIISIRGTKLKELEPILRLTRKNGKPTILKARSTGSEGTGIPIYELINNRKYYETNSKGNIVFTPILEFISGTKKQEPGLPTFYLPKKLHDKLNIEKGSQYYKNTEGIEEVEHTDQDGNTSPKRIKEYKVYEAINTLNANFVWDQDKRLEFYLKHRDTKKAHRVDIKDGWVKADQDGNPVFYGEILIDGKKQVSEYPVDKNTTITFEIRGDQIGPLGDAFVKAEDRMYQHNHRVEPGELVKQRLDLKPYVRLLKKAKIWDDNNQ